MLVAPSDLPIAIRRLRQRVGPWLDRVAKTVGQPTTHVYPTEHVGTVSLPIADLETILRDGGFAWDPLSTYHYTPDGRSADGSWAYRARRFADRQLHVVLFAMRADRTDVYAHDEFNWLRHPVKHAKEEDIRRQRGVATMRRWLVARGVAYERDGPVRRNVRHAVNRVRGLLDDRGIRAR